MVFATKLTVHGEHGAVDVADQAVAKDHAWDLPIAAVADIGQRIDTGHTRRLAPRLLAPRFIRQLGQFRFVLSNRHRVSKPLPYCWPSPSNSRARASVMLRMHAPAS